ncbi:VIT domain-containing protein [Methylobacter luteus]|uniref:VIT domain-containing protein n=1 Tax=Methylobacter luteus TaxID=415 RepID=UPI00042687D4|nr:VIT domain-containing protein [Methylobacter luteus]
MFKPLSIIILLFCIAAGSHAGTTCDDCTESLAPRLWIPDGDPATDVLPLKASHADIRINGPIAEVTVTQHYSNAGKRAINARYVFPGSTHSAVHGLTMKIGNRIVKAKIKEKAQAEHLFAKAQQEGKRAALMTQQRPNVFMMDVANIMPGDDVELKLTYSELLIPEQGVYELVYPTVVGPRYGSDPFQVARDAAWIANPYAKDTGDGRNPAATETRINLSIDSPIALKDLQSVQHEIETHWQNDRSATVSLAGSETQPGNRDFILRFRLQDEQIVSGLMTYSQGAENYFLMMAEPPARVQSGQVMNREYLFVVDVSGSMIGFPLDTTKQLMTRLLSALKPTESFNILFFAGDARVLSPEPLTATPKHIQQALGMMSAYTGGGGTELINALTQAYAMPRKPDVARSLVVVTDGFVSAEREAYTLIADNLNDSNLFAFGIGSSVNRHLIESMAKAGAGEPFIVTGEKEVDAVSTRFRRYIEAPLLSNIAVSGKDVEIYDQEPKNVPLMLAERPIVIFGKYRSTSDQAVIDLHGQSANGVYHVAMPLAEASHDSRAELLPVLWARNRLMHLADMAGNEMESNRDEIVKLGLGYSLLTPYTAFIAVDEVVANAAKQAENVQQPLPLPQGVSEYALASQPMPEPEFYWLMAMLMALIAANSLRKSQPHV